MNWVSTIWSMAAAACFTLGVVHLVIWCHRRRAWDSLLFFSSATGTGFYILCELWMMNAATPEEFATLVRWAHVPLWVLLVSLVAFVRVHLRAGRLWLAWTIVGLRTLSLLLNFLIGENLHYLDVSALQQIPFLGESVTIGNGAPNPLMLIAQSSLVLLLVFAFDATLTVWRRRDSYSAKFTASSIAFLAVSSAIMSVLVMWRFVEWPISAGVFYLGIIAAMGYDLSQSSLRALNLTQDLEESLTRFRQVADTAREFIWEIDPRGIYTYASPSVETILGYSAGELVGKMYFYDLIVPELREEMKADNLQLMAEHKVFRDLPCTKMRKNGTVVELERSGSPMLDANGKIIGYRGADTDVSGRKQAESSFRLVVEASPNGLVLVNEQGHITLVNIRTEMLSQYTREELLGQSVEMLLPQRFRDAHPAQRASYSLKPSSRSMAPGGELFILRKDGSESPVEVGLSAIKTAEGTFGLAVIVDISKRRQDEQEIAQQRNQLAHFSRVSMLGELSGSLAHELNQPLTAILSNAQAAQRFLKSANPDLEELAEILDDIVKDDKRAGEVIRRMRLLLRKGEVQRQPLCLNELVLEVLKLMKNDLIIQGINVQTDLTSNLPIVQADGVELQQVLINLIMNACDATTVRAKNERSLEIRTRPVGGEKLQIEVADNGSGIAEDSLKAIFEPFCTTKAHGLGLGLSVCQTIVRAHGGELWASNNAGDGATFHITLALE